MLLSPQESVGVVVIGRNEGERLSVCLNSVIGQCRAVVYVDSGSTDQSIALARALGASVVELDLAIPFTAARARNAGFEKLQALLPELAFVQFVDGDCEVVAGWLEAGLASLMQQPEVAVVCGRRRERYPEASIYNTLCDMEWDTPVGEAKACGGDALMRVEAFRAVGGFDARLIAGEEPELCLRLRQAGWKILRLDAEMTRHDAAMLHFRQWWRRSRRAGYAYGLGAALHGAPPERHWVKESLRIWLWGLLLPLGLAGLAFWSLKSLVLWAVYPLQIVRIARRQGWLYGSFCVLGKFPELIGQLEFVFNHCSGRNRGLIEYK